MPGFIMTDCYVLGTVLELNLPLNKTSTSPAVKHVTIADNFGILLENMCLRFISPVGQGTGVYTPEFSLDISVYCSQRVLHFQCFWLLRTQV